MKKSIPVPSSSVTYKVLADDDFHIIMIQDRGQFKAYKFQSDSENVKTTYQKKNVASISGNPVIDILHYALLKFGSANSESASGPALYVSMSRPSQQVEKYVRNLQMVCQQLQWRGSLLPSKMGEFVRQMEGSTDFAISLEEFRWKLLTRTPIHLASIQDGNLVPLQDGRNNFEEFVNQLTGNQDFSDSFVNYIHFGCLEELIKKESNIKVVSIMGKQSGGKSYLLNCIFKTRFDVAATRCTDGIWMSLAKVEGQTFVVLDCEGLFSAERNIQEEVKMCLFLAAVSDVTILNADLAFNRHISYLFEKFIIGVARLNGVELFKGVLELTIRDVPSNQDTGTNEEIRSFIDKQKNDSDFFIKLFGGKIFAVLYHNFENRELFERNVRVQCHRYRSTEIPVRWSSGEKLLFQLKTALSNIYNDDSSFTDARVFDLTIKKILEEIYIALQDPSAMPELYRSQKPVLDATVSLGGKSYAVSEHMVSIRLDMTKKYIVFSKILEKAVIPKISGPKTFDQFRRTYWKEWYRAVDNLILRFFVLLKEHVVIYFEQSIGRIDPELAPKVALEKMNIIKFIEDTLQTPHALCLQNCANCELSCLSIRRHIGDCSCETDHRCSEMCSKCSTQGKCTRKAGHKDSHLCNNKHLCNKSCSVPSCLDPCIGEWGHPESVHNCGKSPHTCMEKCLAFDRCGRTCAIDRAKQHDRHNCGQRYCPEPCCMNSCTATCETEDHLHSFPNRGEQPLHFCKNKHPCEGLCEAEGVCKVTPTKSTRIVEEEGNTYSYPYSEISAERLQCVVPINVGMKAHKEPHRCSNSKHTCTARCPDCGQYCGYTINHRDRHMSGCHRNKDICIYISKTLEIDYRDPSTSSSRKMRAGQKSYAEICDLSCKTKGRGHTHPVLCKGGGKCLEITQPMNAVHSNDKYYPDLAAVYDLVRCETYWGLHQWEPPIKSSLFDECPVFCGSPDHDQGERKYCTKELFHTKSVLFQDHEFNECFHSHSAYDICFILDCTGSMSYCFNEVKEVITMVIDNYNTVSRSSMFAIIGYTDHAESCGSFNPDYPVVFYPDTKRIIDFSLPSCSNFLDDLCSDGGGANTGEAMVDGIHAANELIWRENSYRICFIIANEGGHGFDLAGPNAEFPCCPCHFDWKVELKTLKSSIQKCNLVKIGSAVEFTAKAFTNEYETGFEVIGLTEMDEIQETVSESITKVMNGHMEFARSV